MRDKEFWAGYIGLEVINSDITDKLIVFSISVYGVVINFYNEDELIDSKLYTWGDPELDKFTPTKESSMENLVRRLSDLN